MGRGCFFVIIFLANGVNGGLLDWFHRGETTPAPGGISGNPLHNLEASTVIGLTVGPDDKDCVDISKNCSDYVNTLCKDKQYAPIMAKICPQTCHACCWDKSQRCGEWKERGFCTLEFYQVAARHTCPATCGHCTSPQ